MDEARLQAYVNLIGQLLACADVEEFNNILQANQELIDPEFLQVMENYATGLEQQGNNNPAAWLRNMAQWLGQYLNPQAGSIEEYQKFLSEVLQAEHDSNSDPAVVYPILQRRQHLLDDTFAQQLQQWARNKFSQGRAEEVVGIAGVIQNLCIDISEFPLGSRADNLEIAITGYQTLLEVYTRDAFPEDWAGSQNNLGNAYRNRIRGERADNLELAIVAFNLSLEVYTRDAFPEDWAKTQNNLGIAYLYRIREERVRNLELAIAAYNQSLEIYTRDAFPSEWARSQNNLGNAYGSRIRGERADNLELAITAYNQSLEVYTREAFPEYWSRTQNNLGEAYRNRIRGEKADNLELAIAAYNQSLEVYTREAFPEYWAGTKNNLGLAYGSRIRGERADNLELAIAAYNQSLEVYTREAFSEYWATTQNNLGNAYLYRIRGERADNLELAIAALNQSLEVSTREAFPYEWARSQNNLGLAYSYRIRGERAENLELAIAAYDMSLKGYTRDTFPYEWATTQNNRGIAYSNRIKGKKADNLELAIAAYNLSLEVYTREAFSEYWAGTQNNLGLAYSERTRGERADNLELAIAAYNQSLEVSTRDSFPYEWARSQNNLGIAYLGIAYLDRIRGERADNLELAIAALSQSLEVRTRDAFPEDWAGTQNNLGLAYSYRIRGERADNLELAIAAYNLSLEVFTPTAFPIDCLRTGRNLGITANLIEDWKTAIKGYNLAIEAVENTRLQALNPQSRQEVLSNAIDVFHSIIQVHLNLNQLDKALEYIERSKARNLVELMTQKNLKPQGVSQTIIDEYDHLRQQVVNEQIRLQNQSINQNLSRTDNSMPYVQNHSYLKEYQQQFDTFIEQEITPIDPTFKLTQKVEPITFAEIQSLTDSETCLIQWYITSEKILAFIVSSDGKINLWQSTETDLQTFIETADNYLQLYYSENGKQEWIKQLPNLLQGFSKTLHLNEIINLSPPTCQCLIIIPHRLLHILPIHAFPISEDKVLQDKYTVQYAPSCQILQRIQQHQKHELTHLLAIQNPTKDLTFTDLEVNIIATLFTQNQIIAKDNATQNTVTAQLKNPNHHCHHFSCHGSFNPNNPLESALILADKEPFTLSKIFELNLKKSRLVVLSACETGMIDMQSVSDEYIGLPSGFLFAGSQNVVSSLWTVNDLSTAFLMIKFYQILLDPTQQVSVAIALKTAQNWLQNLTVKEYLNQLNYCQQIVKPMQQKLTAKEFTRLIDMIEDEQCRIKDIESNHKPFNNPFYWAAFTASGI
jgi:CHAT domain-containing protein/predicted LPLAT superfamily acyltransferase